MFGNTPQWNFGEADGGVDNLTLYGTYFFRYQYCGKIHNVGLKPCNQRKIMIGRDLNSGCERDPSVKENPCLLGAKPGDADQETA